MANYIDPLKVGRSYESKTGPNINPLTVGRSYENKTGPNINPLTVGRSGNFRPLSASYANGTSGSDANVGGSYSAAGGGMDLYNRQYAQLQAAYAQRDAARQSAYDSIVGGLQAGYNRGAKQANDVAGRALQGAYINRMMSERNLGQQLGALGRSGGAAETTLLNLHNSYGRERGEHERVRADALADLRLALEQGVAQARADLENARASDVVQQAESLMELEKAFAAMTSGGGGGYFGDNSPYVTDENEGGEVGNGGDGGDEPTVTPAKMAYVGDITDPYYAYAKYGKKTMPELRALAAQGQYNGLPWVQPKAGSVRPLVKTPTDLLY